MFLDNIVSVENDSPVSLLSEVGQTARGTGRGFVIEGGCMIPSMKQKVYRLMEGC